MELFGSGGPQGDLHFEFQEETDHQYRVDCMRTGSACNSVGLHHQCQREPSGASFWIARNRPRNPALQRCHQPVSAQHDHGRNFGAEHVSDHGNQALSWGAGSGGEPHRRSLRALQLEWVERKLWSLCSCVLQLQPTVRARSDQRQRLSSGTYVAIWKWRDSRKLHFGPRTLNRSARRPRKPWTHATKAKEICIDFLRILSPHRP